MFLLLKTSDDPSSHIIDGFYKDKTAFECSYNHIHIDTYFDEIEKDIYKTLHVSFSALKKMEASLKEHFPKESFVLILGFDKLYSSLRFYKVREEEIPWIKMDDIEEYLDALYVKVI